MASSFYTVDKGSGQGYVDATTYFVGIISNAMSGFTAETSAEHPIRHAGTFRNAYVYVPTNTATVTSTITLRVNQADTALTVSYTADQTGIKEDTTNAVTVAATDEADWEITVPAEAGTNTLTISTIKCQFTPTTTTDCIGLFGINASPSISAASQTIFVCPTSAAINTTSNVETTFKWRARASFTVSNLYTFVTSNARTTDCVFSTRLNAAAGGQSVTYTSGQTGVKEDTTGTDSLVAGDDFNLQFTTSTGTGAIVFTKFNTITKNTSNIFPLLAGQGSSGSSVAFNVTTYTPVGGALEVSTTEANSQTYNRFPFLAKELGVMVVTNTIATSATTVTVRKNGADTAMTVSYDAAQTGMKLDSVNTVIYNPTDTINYKVVTPNTSGAFNLRYISVLCDTTGIMYDMASNSGYQTAQSTYSWAHFTGGDSRYLVVGVSMLSVAGSSVSSVTYGAENLTLLGTVASGAGAVRVELWGRVAPLQGSNTIAVTLSAALDSAAGATSFTGVHQVSPTEAFNSATATNVGAADATVNVTTVADNDWVIDTVATDDIAITVGAGQTSRWNVTGTLGSGAGSTEGPKTPAGAVTMSWTDVAALATWSIAGIAIRPISASDLTPNYSTNQFLTLMGLGI